METHITLILGMLHFIFSNSMVSCHKGPTRHAYAWQVGFFWQDTLAMITPQQWIYFNDPDTSAK